MFNFIKNIFSSKNNANLIKSLSIETNEEQQERYNQLLVKFALKELEKIDFFDNDKFNVIIDHLLAKINLFKSEEYLSLEEKSIRNKYKTESIKSINRNI